MKVFGRVCVLLLLVPLVKVFVVLIMRSFNCIVNMNILNSHKVNGNSRVVS